MNLSEARKLASRSLVPLDQAATLQQAKLVIRQARKRRKQHAKRTGKK
jgi:hypothetical protein